ncbi:putative pyridine nucleotide-disulfide oxidoreductase RclA [Venturia nashicola]|nr:putative pyridine nucleotide-disulfide oxidoreductase RclA [Venturia nashicola]
MTIEIIGSGQAGSPLATALAKAGRRTLLIEKEHVGGCCINEGCTPTKTMIASGRTAYLSKRGFEFGVVSKVEPLVSLPKVRERKRAIVESFRSGSENRLKVAGVDVMMGKASFVGEMILNVDMSDGKEEQYTASEIFINVGERPAIPDMSGVEETMKDTPGRILDSTSIQELDEIPKTLIVIGGGPVGLEFAQLFKRLGSQVHIMQRSKQLLPREDPEIVQTLFDILIEEGLDISCGVIIKSMAYHPHSDLPIQITTKSSSNESDSYIAGTHILLATGRRPNTDLLNLAATNVTTNARGYIQTSPSLETTYPGIYALGDCTGAPAFTHISYDDFRIIRDNLNLDPKPSPSAFDKRINHHTTDPRKKLIPYVIFTDPQLAHVGLHLHDIPLSARADIKIAKMPMAYVARALEIDEARGMMKAVVNGVTGEILGFSCLSTEGGELMSIVQCAMMGGVKWWDLREAIWAHPTWAECLNNLWGFLEDV